MNNENNLSAKLQRVASEMAALRSKLKLENDTVIEEVVDTAALPVAPVKVSSAYEMFRDSTATSIDLSNVDTSASTDFSRMFYGCHNLTGSFDINQLNVSSAQKLSMMVYNMHNITELHAETLTFPNATHFDNFCFCPKATHIYFNSLLFSSKIKYISSMFTTCSAAQLINIQSADFSLLPSNVTGNSMFSGVPDDCLIIVKDDYAKQWIESKFSNLTNIKTLSEYEASL